MFLLLLLYYFSYWKLFVKLDIGGYGYLVPVYNEYLLCKKLKMDNRFTLMYLFISLVISIINGIYMILSIMVVLCMTILPFLLTFILSGKIGDIRLDSFNMMMIIYVLFFLIYSIMRIGIVYKLSLNFGKSKIWAIILGIFNFIGIFVLGFSDLEYKDNVLDEVDVDDDTIEVRIDDSDDDNLIDDLDNVCEDDLISDNG